MALNYDHSQQLKLSCRLGPIVATTAALTALPYEVCADGMLSVVTADNSIWCYRLAGAEALGPTVLADDAAKGQWVATQQHAVAGLPKLASVRNVTTGALGAYTRTANVILANANGALGAIDGVTNVVGDRLLLKNGAAGADNGAYRVDAVGGAGSKYQITRVGDANASAEVVAGMLVYASEGTANGNTWFYLSTDDPITLNTTALVFTYVPTLVGFTSLETRVSTEECTRSTADSSLTVLVSSADSSLKVIQSTGDSSLTVLVASADSSLKVIDSAGDSSLTLITSSVETRLSTEQCSRSTADSSLTVLVSSADSSLKVIDSAGDSSLTLITSSVETRLSSEECTRSTADSSLTVLISSADSSLKVIDSAGDSSLTVLVASADSSLKVISSTAESSLTVLVSSADSSLKVIQSTADSSLDARVDVFATRNVGMSTHEFREVDANADVGNIAANGGVLAADTTPSLSGDANHAQIITWVTGNVDQIGCAKVVPLDFSGAAAATVRAWVASGATDAASFSLTTHWDGGATITDAFDDSATKSAVMHEITATIAAADIPDAPDFLWLELTPPAHATDTIILYAVAVEYTSESA